MKTIQRITAAIALSVGIAASGTSSADSIFIGDAASEGLDVASRGAAFTVEDLTVVNLAGRTARALSEPTVFGVKAGQTVTPTTVNFVAESAGILTPFIALVPVTSGVRDFKKFTILTIGDGIVVDAASTGLVNADFTVGGAAVEALDITATGQIVAGFFADGTSLVERSRNDTAIADIVLSGDGLTGDVGKNIVDPGLRNFNKFTDTHAFNIGVDIDTASKPTRK